MDGTDPAPFRGTRSPQKPRRIRGTDLEHAGAVTRRARRAFGAGNFPGSACLGGSSRRRNGTTTAGALRNLRT